MIPFGLRCNNVYGATFPTRRRIHLERSLLWPGTSTDVGCDGRSGTSELPICWTRLRPPSGRYRLNPRHRSSGWAHAAGRGRCSESRCHAHWPRRPCRGAGGDSRMTFRCTMFRTPSAVMPRSPPISTNAGRSLIGASTLRSLPISESAGRRPTGPGPAAVGVWTPCCNTTQRMGHGRRYGRTTTRPALTHHHQPGFRCTPRVDGFGRYPDERGRPRGTVSIRTW